MNRINKEYIQNQTLKALEERYPNLINGINDFIILASNKGYSSIEYSMKDKETLKSIIGYYEKLGFKVEKVAYGIDINHEEDTTVEIRWF